ncbi:MAG TPA: CDGSH iron-sulfur domain-containing protein [Chitinophagaceae bacterium]|nr:CDGSH iron-sulfur domain-containing protein [Chitinophagaceae bacterium]
MDLPKTAACFPQKIKVQPGKVYSWCTCGLSASQPFCDNTHRTIEGMPYRSIKVVFDKEEEIFFCQCKHTKTPPFCDDTHLALKKELDKELPGDASINL